MPSSLGRELLADDGGRDPYIEDQGTLWFLHWQFFLPPFLGASWPLAFNSPPRAFDHKELTACIIGEARRRPTLKNLSDSSFEKDASCIIRMYAPSARNDSEIRCPFTDLGLIEATADKGRYRFSTGLTQFPPPLIFLAASLSYADLVQSGARSISLAQIARSENSPGIAFRMSETECGRTLDQAANSLLEDVSFVESDGIRQLQFTASASDLYHQSLRAYYSGVLEPCC